MQPKEPNPQLDRVQYELRATGIKPNPSNRLRSGIHSRGYLPHVKHEGAVYFVTFRLADSLPKEVLIKFLAEKAERLRRLEIVRADQHNGASSKPIAETEHEIRSEEHTSELQSLTNL